MFRIKNVGITAASEKRGTANDGRKWLKHGYKFMGVDGWFSHFVKEGTPLYPKGTVVKTLDYEESGDFQNIKQMVVQSMPKPDEAGTSSGPSPIEVRKLHPWENKDHPVWFCGRWATDLVIARAEKATPKVLSEVDLGTSTVEIASTIYTGLSQLLKSPNPPGYMKNAESTGEAKAETQDAGLEEPPQEPALGPNQFDQDYPEDDIPF